MPKQPVNEINRKRTRVTDELPRERLDRCAELLRQCKPHWDVEIQLCHEWGIKPRQARNYMRRVYEEWAEQAKEEAPRRREEWRTKLEALLCKAIESEHWTSAVRALEIGMRFDGILEDRVKHTVEAGIGISVNPDPEAARKRLAELEAKHRQ